jgi:hypothetical protein
LEELPGEDALFCVDDVVEAAPVLLRVPVVIVDSDAVPDAVTGAAAIHI